MIYEPRMVTWVETLLFSFDSAITWSGSTVTEMVLFEPADACVNPRVNSM